MADENQSVLMPVKLSRGAVIAVFLLTFIVWIFFYVMDMQLDAKSTTLVAVVMLALVIAARWLWSRVRQRGGIK
jgi:membrane protein DedA with SNARE-associated domain